MIKMFKISIQFLMLNIYNRYIHNICIFVKSQEENKRYNKLILYSILNCIINILFIWIVDFH